jgi:hypothetical protein
MDLCSLVYQYDRLNNWEFEYCPVQGIFIKFCLPSWPWSLLSTVLELYTLSKTLCAVDNLTSSLPYIRFQKVFCHIFGTTLCLSWSNQFCLQLVYLDLSENSVILCCLWGSDSFEKTFLSRKFRHVYFVSALRHVYIVTYLTLSISALVSWINFIKLSEAGIMASFSW